MLLSSRAGQERSHLPLLVPLKQIPQITCLPTGSTVKQQDALPLHHGRQTHRRLVVFRAGFIRQRCDGGYERQRYDVQRDAIGRLARETLHQLVHFKRKLHTPLTGSRGRLLLLPQHLSAVPNLQHEGRAGRTTVLQNHHAPHLIAAKHTVRMLQFQNGQI